MEFGGPAAYSVCRSRTKSPTTSGFGNWLPGARLASSVFLSSVDVPDWRADRAATNLCARYPRLRLAGTHHGYFAKEGPANQAVVDEINGASPDILLVCFGMPLQERWVSENLSQLRVHVILTGGAAIDYGAGAIPVVPRWMAKLQLEWLFRFLIEPVRMFRRYIIGNPLFLARVFLVKLRKRQLIGS